MMYEIGHSLDKISRCDGGKKERKLDCLEDVIVGGELVRYP